MLLPQCGVLLTNSASIVNSCYCCYCHWGSECGIRRYWRRRRSPESPVDGAFTRTIPAHPLAGADVGGVENCGWRTLAENSITGARRIRRITSSWNGIKRARCIRGQRSQGDFRTVASPMASTPHWGGHLSLPDPLSPPLFSEYLPIQSLPPISWLPLSQHWLKWITLCALSLLQYTHWCCSKASNLGEVAFHSQRINLVLPRSPPIFCRSSRFCSEMTNGRFSLFGFYSRWSSTPMVIGKIGPISEMGGCSQFSTRTQPTTPVLLMATLIFYFFYFITTTNPLPTNAYFSHFISLPILLLNFWDLPFLRGIKIDLIMIWWTAVGTLFEYYWKRFCICPKATHVNYVRSVDVNIEWELGDSANLSDDKTQFYLIFHQLRLIHTYMILWKR